MATLEVKNVIKKFGKQTALNDINFKINDGDFVCILGPSGCGKSTLLRVIAGLEDINAGTVMINGKDVTTEPPANRNFGIVFQSYALFPNMNVEENVAYGLWNRKVPKEEIKSRVADVLEMVGLTEHRKKYPAQLSGGQQQRVAISRAIILKPEFLLLDEPLSALDAKVRAKLRKEIRQLQQKLGITTVMVTHDQEEALSMADVMIVMNNAVIEQMDTPERIYESPVSEFVADFVGTANFVGNSKAIRPESLRLYRSAEYNVSAVSGIVDDVEFRGAFYRIEVSSDIGRLTVDVSSGQKNIVSIKPGSEIFVDIPSDKLISLKSA